MPGEQFIDIFCEKLEILHQHSFIASQQAASYNKCRRSLHPREFLVKKLHIYSPGCCSRFSLEATIHPFVAYFVDSGELCHLSYVIISDCLCHDTTAVYLFQKCFITSCRKGCILRKQSISQMVRLPSTRKERTSSLCDDFGISAEWHFYSTSHGKGACDGVGGAVK